MPGRPLVLVHGYSAEAKCFDPWMRALSARGYDVSSLHVCSYRSLTNEVSIRDVAEGFDRALRIRAGISVDEPFDAIVHSTGMLVIRSWLAAYAGRRDRLKHLVALAPATFGSPLAHKGRSWLGSVFKGNKTVGPDFLEAGDRILDGLELAGRFSWDLAHEDLLGRETWYGPTGATPYVFVLCGNRGYGGLRGFISEAGSDGTVRWAGCALTTRKITFDLTVDPARIEGGERIDIAAWRNPDIPLIPIKGKNHGTILSSPGEEAVDLVDEALRVDDAAQFRSWMQRAWQRTMPARQEMDEWQQFVVRAVDERGDPITDYNVQLFGRTGGASVPLKEFAVDVHVYRADPSLRSFHVNLTKLKTARMMELVVRVIASSGSQLVGYTGFGTDKLGDTASGTSRDGKWDGSLDLSSLLGDATVSFFYPFTTTLLEFKLNREPLPLSGKNEVCWF